MWCPRKEREKGTSEPTNPGRAAGQGENIKELLNCEKGKKDQTQQASSFNRAARAKKRGGGQHGLDAPTHRGLIGG